MNYGVPPGGGTALFSESFEYDPSGNVTKHVTRDDETVQMWYDVRSRLVWRAQTSGAAGAGKARTQSLSYDQLGNLVGIGSLDDAQFCHASFYYARDGLGRIRQETQGWGLSDGQTTRSCGADYKTVHFDYRDAQGNERSRPTKITWPDNFHVFYDLDELDRVAAIRLCSAGHPSCTGATLVNYSYDELGRRIQSRTHNNTGVLTRYRWETDNDLAAVAHDAANDSVGDVVFAAAFNRAGEPTAEDITNTAYVWPTATTAAATFNPLNQMTSYAAETLLYDDNGNLSLWRNRTYVHDTDNQLREVWEGVPGSGTRIAQYEYDALGRRVRKTTYSPTTTHTFFLYAGDAEIGEYDSGSNLIRRYIPGPTAGETVAMIEGSTITYLHTDRTGSVVAASNSAGQIVERYKISEWGELNAGLTGVPFRFIGARFDPETGLYYMRARYYSPELGRFVETDPAGYAQQTNLYAYSANSPLVLADPGGREYLAMAVVAAAVTFSVAKTHNVIEQLATHNWDMSQVDWRTAHREGTKAAAITFATQVILGALGEVSSGAGAASGGVAEGSAPDEVTATAERMVEPYIAGYDSAHPLFHFYPYGPTKVCEIGPNCTLSAVNEFAGEVHVPFQAMGNGGPGVYYGLAQPIEYSSPAFGIHINQTLPGHVFHDGRVVSAVFAYERSAYIYTVGVGVGVGGNRGVNLLMGPGLFGDMHARIYIKFNTPWWTPYLSDMGQR